MPTDSYEWDPAKAAANLRKHGVRFADAVTALEDPLCLTMSDPDSNGEQRWLSVGMDALGRVLVTAFTLRGRTIRIISSRPATRTEQRRYRNE